MTGRKKAVLGSINQNSAISSVCNMDGTLPNSKSQISLTNAKALKEALLRGVKVVIVTGKARPAVIDILKAVDLACKNGVISEFSPGVFLQGLIAYGRLGREIFRSNLDVSVCREACLYSWEHKVPLIAFSNDRRLTLFEDPLVDSLHTVYHEPKAEIMPSVEHVLSAADIQKMIFLDTAEGVATNLQPFWSEATGSRANVVQAVPDMLEIVPPGTSYGSGVKLLLDHLGVTAKEEKMMNGQTCDHIIVLSFGLTCLLFRPYSGLFLIYKWLLVMVKMTSR